MNLFRRHNFFLPHRFRLKENVVMTTPTSKNNIDYEKLWKSSNEEQRRILLCLMYSLDPFSIDTLMALSEAPAVSVLNVMEDLKAKCIISSKGREKGVYTVKDQKFIHFLENNLFSKSSPEVLKLAIRYYNSSFPEGQQRTLLLGRLHLKMADGLNGAEHIKRAADILYNSGERKHAVSYYDYLLKHFNDQNLTDLNVDDYLESALKKSYADRYMVPIKQIIELLLEAEKTAKRFERLGHLAQIKAALAQEFRASGQFDKGNSYFDDVRKIAKKIKDPNTLKTISLAMHSDLQWKGRIAEAIHRYEEMTGSLEEFGDKERTLRIGLMVALCYHYSGRISRSKGMIDEIQAKAASLNIRIIVIFADLCRVLCCIDHRRLQEAESLLDKLCDFDDLTLGYHLLFHIHLCRAYLHCMKEDYQSAFDHHTKAGKYAKLIGSKFHEASWIFEYLYILENKGLFDKSFNYDSEIERALNMDNIHMKGVALRYRAQKAVARGKKQSILDDLNESERLLSDAGAKIELARTRISLGEFYLNRKDLKSGRVHLTTAWTGLPSICKNLFPKHLLSFIPRKLKIEDLVEKITEINISLGSEKDRHLYLTRIINISMDFTMATRGAFFFFDQESEPELAASRNIDPSLLTPDKLDFIHQAVRNAAKSGREIVYTQKRKASKNAAASQNTGITSFVCLPASLEDHTYGYLYLDNLIQNAFTPIKDSPFLRMLCSQIAIALSNIYLFEEMRKLKDRFEDEAIFYKREMGAETGLDMIIGQSKEIKKVVDHIRQVAATDSTVMILGETGVGKELVAKSVHAMSSRKNGPFIPVNIASLPQELVASELFGHERGAFTGANERKKGRFELADGGTIFLDEIGDLPLPMQTKLLRVLQENTFERLGSSKQIKSDFRVVAATHKNLLAEIEKGAFRQDLFYRLNIFPIDVPALRERKGDIPLLANYFISKFSRKLGKIVYDIPQDEIKKLLAYDWPGNVRELEHIIERSVILLQGKQIRFTIDNNNDPQQGPGSEKAPHDEAVPVPVVSQPPPKASGGSLADIERAHIIEILTQTHWRVSGPFGAANILGLKPTTLFTRMKKLGISKPEKAKTSGSQ